MTSGFDVKLLTFWNGLVISISDCLLFVIYNMNGLKIIVTVVLEESGHVFLSIVLLCFTTHARAHTLS